ncbi:Uncharacterised protein [Serratia fonticola]|uniref:hypothetical protein n=1 Tax=Serratia fonticola TaxID=47917 RepID=UPI00217BA39F|nr:hypothetical protein [Serratia fonticola]CAI0699059.1 Uncharacterised protein [Serratia fonticola]
MDYDSHKYEVFDDLKDLRQSTTAIFDDITKLLSLAEESIYILQRAKDTLLKIKVYFMCSVLAAVMLIFLILPYSFRVNNVQLLSLIGGVFFLLIIFAFISIFIFPKYKSLALEVRIQRESLKEIMEIIFNLKSLVANRGDFDVITMTILELKLKRMHFY